MSTPVIHYPVIHYPTILVSWSEGCKPPADLTLQRRCAYEVQQEALAHACFSEFDFVSIRNLPHESDSDPNLHVTVWCQSEVQLMEGRHQVAHMYMDEEFVRSGHILFQDIHEDTRIYDPNAFLTVRSTAAERAAQWAACPKCRGKDARGCYCACPHNDKKTGQEKHAAENCSG
ncbi:hypothetical protein BX600DRAFT_435343 [Xylariales sp. PMI_506]|nr:hypothetical protein BX600DRAFT_435343 [Xylariales sp. PMI_506]